MTLTHRNIILYGLFVGILSFILSYQDEYLTNIHHTIHAKCVVHLDSFILGCSTTMAAMYCSRSAYLGMFIGIMWGIVGIYTKLFPIWIDMVLKI